MRRVLAVVLIASFAGTSDAYGQANCTRTLDDYNDEAYSEKSMSYSWSGGQAPDWFAGAVEKWNACSGSPALSAGTGGEKRWTFVYTSARPRGMRSSVCGYSDDHGDFGATNTIYLIEDSSRCGDPLSNLFLHEAGHSLGLDHDGPGCPTTVMTGDLSKPLADAVSPINCTAVEKFKREKINRDKGVDTGGGDGALGGGSNPGRGTDPISRCTDNPDLCEDVELVCTKVTVSSSSGVKTTGWECAYLY